jgi:hypothetical protein
VTPIDPRAGQPARPAKLHRRYGVPVGFEWFVDGVYSGSPGFGGEESAGACFFALGWCGVTDTDRVVSGLVSEIQRPALQIWRGEEPNIARARRAHCLRAADDRATRRCEYQRVTIERPQLSTTAELHGPEHP